MQFRKSSDSPVNRKIAGLSAHPKPRRPQWLMKWINEQGQYVLLECGHKESFANVGVTQCLIRTFQGLQVECSECDQFRKVLYAIDLLEYLDIPKPESSQTPLF